MSSRIIYDLSTVRNSNAIGDAAGAFTAADIGATLTTPAVPLGTRIATILNACTATITRDATMTTTGLADLICPPITAVTATGDGLTAARTADTVNIDDQDTGGAIASADGTITVTPGEGTTDLSLRTVTYSRTITASFTEGSVTFTSAPGTLTDTDVGASIWDYAPPAVIPAGTTIVSVLPWGGGTLSQAATADATDDTVGITKMIVAPPSITSSDDSVTIVTTGSNLDLSVSVSPGTVTSDDGTIRVVGSDLSLATKPVLTCVLTNSSPILITTNSRPFDESDVGALIEDVTHPTWIAAGAYIVSVDGEGAATLNVQAGGSSPSGDVCRLTARPVRGIGSGDGTVTITGRPGGAGILDLSVPAGGGTTVYSGRNNNLITDGSGYATIVTGKTSATGAFVANGARNDQGYALFPYYVDETTPGSVRIRVRRANGDAYGGGSLTIDWIAT